MRAYILPTSALPSEAQGALAELQQWGVPESILKGQSEQFRTAWENNPRDERAARDALNKILDDFDYWDSYTDWCPPPLYKHP